MRSTTTRRATRVVGNAAPRAAGPVVSAKQPAAGLRGTLEQRFLGSLRMLSRQPPWVPPLLLGALFVVGLVLRGWLGVLWLLLVGAALAGLTYLSWSRLAPNPRLLRVGVLGLFAGVVLGRIIDGG